MATQTEKRRQTHATTSSISSSSLPPVSRWLWSTHYQFFDEAVAGHGFFGALRNGCVSEQTFSVYYTAQTCLAWSESYATAWLASQVPHSLHRLLVGVLATPPAADVAVSDAPRAAEAVSWLEKLVSAAPAMSCGVSTVAAALLALATFRLETLRAVRAWWASHVANWYNLPYLVPVQVTISAAEVQQRAFAAVVDAACRPDIPSSTLSNIERPVSAPDDVAAAYQSGLEFALAIAPRDVTPRDHPLNHSGRARSALPPHPAYSDIGPGIDAEAASLGIDFDASDSAAAVASMMHSLASLPPDLYNGAEPLDASARARMRRRRRRRQGSDEEDGPVRGSDGEFASPPPRKRRGAGCPECKRWFSTASNRNRHMRTKHDKDMYLYEGALSRRSASTVSASGVGAR